MVKVWSFSIVVLVHFFNLPVAKTDDSKIVGGFAVKIEAIPFIVSVQMKRVGHYCGGALLTLGHVLTGCHCVARKLATGVTHHAISIRSPTYLSVVAGTADLYAGPKDRMSQKRKVGKIRIHPKCDYTLILSHDFAILYLRRPFRKSSTVKPFAYPLNMPAKDFDSKTSELVRNDKKHCYVAGWGATEQGETPPKASSELKAVRMRIISDRMCAEKLGRENDKFLNFAFGSNAQMCSLSFGERENASDCVGDSGGPFFCGHIVYGTVSYGFECGFWDTPNVYAKLSFAIPWINSLNLSVGESDEKSKIDEARSHHSSAGPMVHMPSYLMWLIVTKVTWSVGRHSPKFGT